MTAPLVRDEYRLNPFTIEMRCRQLGGVPWWRRWRVAWIEWHQIAQFPNEAMRDIGLDQRRRANARGSVQCQFRAVNYRGERRNHRRF